MGLHRDPTSYTTCPVEIQLRRLIWFHIGFLDIRTCESTGPRPQIRRDEFDTHFPLNVDDATLEEAFIRGEQVTEDSRNFTDMTITRMRFECYEMHRVLWTERPKMQKPTERGEKKVTVTSLLSRIQAFKGAMEKTYLPMLSKNNPQHAVAMEMYNISSTRLYINVLHPFASNARNSMPERIRNVMLSACIMIIEHSINIEQEPALKQWSWYMGALHQYHAALLLVTEMYVTEDDPVRLDRIWRCVDYSFDLPPDIDRIEKSRMVLKELSDRVGSYANMRRVRAALDMPSPSTRNTAPKGRESSQQSRKDVLENSYERGQSVSTQSSSGGYAANVRTQPQEQYPPTKQQPSPQQQQYNPPALLGRGPLGSMPQVDWGTIELGTPSPQPPSFVSSADTTYDFNNYAPTVSSAPTSDLLGITNAGTGTDRSHTPAGPGPTGAALGGGRSGLGASPMQAAINDIDWVSTPFLFSFLNLT
jgi:hypothetical protein